MLGTANEYPTNPPVPLVIAVFIPIKSPLVLTNAPPLFPELTAASVWINDWFLESKSFKSLERFKKLDLSNLISGTYIIEIKTLIENDVENKKIYKFIKK